MKEVTYEDWQKNPTVRMMWVWNDDEEQMKKHKVLYVLSEEEAPVSDYRVIALTIEHNSVVSRYIHCAEIEEQRRMTNKELSRWLREKPTREFKYSSSISCSVHSTYTYTEDEGEAEVSKDVVIREGDGKWRAPLEEVEE